ncbi:MAG: hypothetical protein AAFY47_01545 [Pseudomonadota bacterium]
MDRTKCGCGLAKCDRGSASLLICHILAIIYAAEVESDEADFAWIRPLNLHALPLEKQGIFIMRKLVIATAIATSLGLVACSESAEQAGETVDAMAADAEANAEAAGAMAGEAAEATGEAAEGAAEATGEAAEGAADATKEAAEAATDEAEQMMAGE